MKAVLSAVLFLAPALALAGSPDKASPIGKRIDDFKLRDFRGAEWLTSVRVARIARDDVGGGGAGGVEVHLRKLDFARGKRAFFAWLRPPSSSYTSAASAPKTPCMAFKP